MIHSTQQFQIIEKFKEIQVQSYWFNLKAQIFKSMIQHQRRLRSDVTYTNYMKIYFNFISITSIRSEWMELISMYQFYMILRMKYAEKFSCKNRRRWYRWVKKIIAELTWEKMTEWVFAEHQLSFLSPPIEPCIGKLHGEIFCETLLKNFADGVPFAGSYELLHESQL